MGSEKLESFRLGERCSIKSSKRIFAREYVEAGVPFWRSKDVIDKSLGVFQQFDLYISKERFNEISGKYGSPQKGDLLISSVGNRSGQPYVVQEEGEFYFKDGNILWINDFVELDAEFLSYWLKSSKGQAALSSVMIGSAQKALTIDALRSLQVHLPVYEMQLSAVKMLKILDNKITLNRQINQTLEQMAQTLFKSWFVDFDPVIDNALDAGNAIPDELQARAEQRQALRHAVNEANAENQPHSTRTNPVASDGLASPYKSLPDDIRQLFPNEFEESELGWVPKGWGVDELQSIAPLTNKSITPNRKPDELWEHYSIPAFDGGKIPSFDQGEMIKSGKYIVPENSILVSKLNPTTKRVWMPMIKNSFLSVCSTEFMPFVPNNAVVRNFLYCLLSSDNVQTMICNRVTGTTGSRQRAQPKEVAAMRLLLPTVDLMEVFSNKVAPHLLRVLKGRDENQTLTKLRDTLLPKLISGELRLDEVESTIAETTTA